MIPNKKELKYFELAKRLSLKVLYSHKLGAVVVKKGKVLGLGYNKPYRTHTKSNNPFRTVHAELDAIVGLTQEELRGSTIFIYRSHKNGSLANAMPCKYCQHLLLYSGIKRVCFTFSNNYKEYYLW